MLDIVHWKFSLSICVFLWRAYRYPVPSGIMCKESVSILRCSMLTCHFFQIKNVAAFLQRWDGAGRLAVGLPHCRDPPLRLRHSSLVYSSTRGLKEMSSIFFFFADKQRPCIWAQMREGGRGCRVSANEYNCTHGAQINFRDLTPSLTCVFSSTSGFSRFQV